jgi:hypothetical protein
MCVHFLWGGKEEEEDRKEKKERKKENVNIGKQEQT